MTARAEYAYDEWVLLLTAPLAAIGAVTFADGAGLFEPVAEAITAAAVQARGAERFPGNELIAALTNNKERIDPARLPQPQEVGETPDAVVARLRALALEKCAAAMRLLAERTNPIEAAGYAAWVMDAAKAAAAARRHKAGLFAAPGPTVGAEERAMLEELSRVLGVEVGELPREVASPGAGSTGPSASAQIPAPDTVRPSRNGTGPDMPSGPMNPG